MKHSSNTRPIVSAAVLLTAAFAVSCQMDQENVLVTENSQLRFELTSACDASVEDGTRSSAKNMAIDTPYGFSIMCSEESSFTYPDTRAVLVNSVSQTEFADNGFGLYGWDGEGTKVFNNVAVSVSGTTGTPAQDYMWKKGENMSFVGFYPKTESIFGNAAASGAWTFGYTVPTTAAAQKDLMLAYFTGQSSTGTAPLSFTHPLASVKFVIGKTDDADKEKIGKITSISLKGIYASGTCTVTPSGNSLSYGWAASGSTTAKASSSGETLVDNKELGDGFTFVVIPQNLASVNVTLEIGTSLDKTFSVVLKTGTWQAGKTAVYTITPKFQAGIDVDDNVEGLVKSDVIIKNTGTRDEYVRAVITGAWCDVDGNIVAPWDRENEGKFTGLCGTGWTYNATDGFYYYTSLVEPDEELKTDNGNQLFDTYTVQSDKFPEGASKLILNILVQSVVNASAADYTNAWN